MQASGPEQPAPTVPAGICDPVGLRASSAARYTGSMDRSLFAALPDRDLRREGVLIGEGRILADRVLARCRPLAVLAVPSAAAEAEALAAGRCPVEVLEVAAISGLVGYPFHRGLMVAAERPQARRIAELDPMSRRLVVLPEAGDPENLGAIARSAAALGWDALALGLGSCDPFGRRALRCSMGAVLSFPVYSDVSVADIETLSDGGWSVVVADAGVGAAPLGGSDATALLRSERLALVFGNERRGVGAAWMRNRTVAIPQVLQDPDGVDSLNVAAAAAILLWEGRRIPLPAEPGRA